MPRQIYSSDVRLWATIYVVADSKEEAQRLIAERVADGAVDVGESEDVSGKRFESSEFPQVSFAPAMSCDSNQEISLEKIEEVGVEVGASNDDEQEKETT
ncbi:MAG: hypothetical protein ACREEJ_01110 [Ensifer adhaerens]